MKSNLKVLLVEDNDDHANVIERHLKKYKHTHISMERKATLQTGLACLTEQTFDALLLDLRLPDSDIDNTLSTTLSHSPSIPIIVLSSLRDETLASKAVHSGAQDYLVKEDMTVENIVRSIRHAIERKQLENKLKQYAEQLAQRNLDLENIVAERTKALSQSEKQYRSLVQLAPLGIITLDRRGSILFTNPEFKKLFGYSEQDIKRLKLSDLFHQDDIASMLEQFETMVAKEHNPFKRTLKLRKSDLSEMWCSITLAAIKSKENQSSQFICLIEDMSERKLQEQLEREKKVAEAANRAKTEFLTNISHEIRTPLAAITGFVDLAIESNGHGGCHNYLQTIKRNSHHLLSLVNDLLDLSKIEAGQLDINVASFSLVEEMNNALSAVKASAEEKRLTLEVHYSGLIPERIESDPQKFRQIFINLINNSIKYTDQGKINITIRVDVPNDDESPGILNAVIEDTGRGMDENVLNKLFQPFSRGNSTSVLAKEGLGIGLALSKNLATKLGGDITLIETAPGKGTKFKVTLAVGHMDEVHFVRAYKIRRSSPPDMAVSTPMVSIGNMLRDKKILLAEDAEDMQILIRHYLERAGANVKVCNDGKMAFEMALSNEFDTILMDIQMPKLNGYEATKKLRSHNFKGIIIALTAHAFKEEQEHCLSIGFDGFLTKPILPENLITTIFKFTLRAAGQPISHGRGVSNVTKLSSYINANANANANASANASASSTVPSAPTTTATAAATNVEQAPVAVTSERLKPLFSIYAQDDAIKEASAIFFKNLTKKTEALFVSISDQDWSAVAKIAHQIKGSSSCYGYPEMTTISKKLEDEAKQGHNGEVAKGYVDRLVNLSKCAELGLSH